MKIPKLQIGNITAELPIIQGGMGVRVSLSSLASAVANEGGIGTIASVGLGDLDILEREFVKQSSGALTKEVRKARSMCNSKGHIAVNIMGVLSNSDDLVRAAVEAGAQIIVYGAGLPINLPTLVEDSPVNLVPIVSSARVANLILKVWDKRYNRTVDGFIIEGPLAGGHLGFSEEQLRDPQNFSLDKILPEVMETVKEYEDKFGQKIPLIAAGGIFTGRDIARMLSLGASGVQMATRFVCTEECDVSPEFKQAYLDLKEEDITIIKSPAGLPGRAIRNKFLKGLETHVKLKIRCPYKCLTTCKITEARYCIARALLNSYFGKVDEGLIFCGQNAHRIEKIVTVKELIAELKTELEAA